ncbi:MAG: hypothetical protein ACRC3B_12080, partial [Bacteroidia bacterium]
MSLMNYIRRKVLEQKITYRIFGKYPRMFPGSRIRSLLPPEVEKLIQHGTVIEEDVVLPAHLKFIGRYVYIGKSTFANSCESIGAFTSISLGVRIGLISHPQNYISTSPAFYAKRRGLVSENTFSEDEGKSTIIGADVL